MKTIGMIADHPTPKISDGRVTFTLNSRDYKGVMIVILNEDNKGDGEMMANEKSEGQAGRTFCMDVGFFQTYDDVAGTQLARQYKDPPITCFDNASKAVKRRHGSVVRRLTPLECERLQGFPDGWTDIGEWADSKGKKHKDADSPRYKALGNSIALPYWKVLARRISAQYDRDITMGSLFDGIGGFPLAFMHCGATPLWASEIEEFCIAVTKKRFGDDKK